MLIHQIPPKPAYFRVKVWRRLLGLGAVAIKNSVYVLPRTDQTLEDFQWVLREIIEEGGEATLCDARFIDGLDDDRVRGRFEQARGADYEDIANETRALLALTPDGQGAAPGTELATGLERLKRRLATVAAIDFFGAAGQESSAAMVRELEAKILGKAGRVKEVADGREGMDLRGLRWVTRQGVHVDRIATAWLVRRFIDPSATFKFVPGRGYRPLPGEIRFDMFEAELTHEGDRCTFEVVLERARLADPALTAIAEIVHDIDLKDEKFGRPETVGIARLIASIAMTRKSDEARLDRGAELLDDLYEWYRRQRGTARR